MRTTINGIQMAYTDKGEGIPLVFIHGFPLNRETWSKQVEAFKSNYRVIAPDLRGLGETEATPGPVSMGRFAEDLQALLQHLETGPAILVGHSMGGYVALAFAAAFPKALRALVLVSTKGGADSSEVAATRRATAEKVRTDGIAVVVDTMAPKMLSASHSDKAKSAEVRAFMEPSTPEGIISALLGMAERPDMRPSLGKIRARTLVISGADDTIIPASESENLMMAIPSAQLKILPEAGHLVAFEQADAFNDALREWLAWGSSLSAQPEGRARGIRRWL